jgi:hypothetical protein
MGDWVTDLVMPWEPSSSERAENAQNKAIEAQQSAEDRRASLAEDQFAYQKLLQDPFFKSSLPAYYSLVDAITGKRQNYADPNYTLITEGANKGKYQGTNGAISATQPMQTSSAFKPTETDAYKWKQSQMEKNTSRTLRSLGRANSTYGMNAIGDQNRNLASTEYDTQLGRLADLTNIARGGASSLANASTGYSNQQQQGLTNMGNNVANASLAGGMMKQNSLYNNQSNMMGLANLGLKAYDAWGNKGGGNDYGSTWNDSGGDINNVDFGDDWGTWADGSKA